MDSILISFVLLLGIFSSYFLPQGLNRLVFLFLLTVFYFTDKDYLWIAFFLAINFSPGGFFMGATIESQHHLPIYTILRGYSFSLFDIFLVISLYKAIQKKSKIFYVYNLYLPAFGILVLVLVGLIFGANSETYIIFFRGLLACSLIFSLPVLLNKEISFYKFIYCFFPFVFFEVVCQIYAIRTGQMLVQFLDPTYEMSVDQLSSGSIRAIGYGYNIITFSLILSFVFFVTQENILPKWYIILIISLCLFSSILSATRQTIILYFIIIILNSFYSKVVKSKNFLLLISGIVLFIFVVNRSFDSSSAIAGSADRFMSGFEKDNPTNTFQFRIEKRLPVIINNIKQSPIVGYGISQKMYLTADSHLGGILFVMIQGGIVGLIIMIAFVINLFRTNKRFILLFSRSNSVWGLYLKILVNGLIGYLIVNFIIDAIYVYPTTGISILVIFVAIGLIIINHGIGNKYFSYE